jgi:hypothetical protein
MMIRLFCGVKAGGKDCGALGSREGTMKFNQECWWPLLLFVSCSPSFSQAIMAAGEADSSIASASWTIQPDAVAPLDLSTEGQASSTPPQAPGAPAEKPYGWHIAAYPLLAWAPIFGSSVTLPPMPSNPTAPPPSGETNSSLGGAYFGGARVEKGGWSGDALFMWAALEARRSTPFAEVKLQFVFGDALLGHKVLPGLYLEGGFRRLALDFRAHVETDTESRAPGFWDPLIGMTYRRELGKKWRVLIHGDGGGFGVGSDVDVTATGRAEWQFARHFGMAMGYGGMHFSVTDTVEGETVKLSPTMHGPIIGFGIFF